LYIFDVLTSSWDYTVIEAKCNWYYLDINNFTLLNVKQWLVPSIYIQHTFLEVRRKTFQSLHPRIYNLKQRQALISKKLTYPKIWGHSRTCDPTTIFFVIDHMIGLLRVCLLSCNNFGAFEG
jgi:hypothetical protein